MSAKEQLSEALRAILPVSRESRLTAQLPFLASKKLSAPACDHEISALKVKFGSMHVLMSDAMLLVEPKSFGALPNQHFLNQAGAFSDHAHIAAPALACAVPFTGQCALLECFLNNRDGVCYMIAAAIS